MRNAGPVGYPGSGEVVNIHPRVRRIQKGITMLPCLEDVRQSGKSDSPSILNVSPEAAVGGNLPTLQTGDRIRVDLAERSVQLFVDDTEIARRRAALQPFVPKPNTPWEELHRSLVTQLNSGSYLDWTVSYRDVGKVKPPPL